MIFLSLEFFFIVECVRGILKIIKHDLFSYKLKELVSVKILFRLAAEFISSSIIFLLAVRCVGVRGTGFAVSWPCDSGPGVGHRSLAGEPLGAEGKI